MRQMGNFYSGCMCVSLGRVPLYPPKKIKLSPKRGPFLLLHLTPILATKRDLWYSARFSGLPFYPLSVGTTRFPLLLVLPSLWVCLLLLFVVLLCFLLSLFASRVDIAGIQLFFTNFFKFFFDVADRGATARTTTFVEPCSIQKRKLQGGHFKKKRWSCNHYFSGDM